MARLLIQCSIALSATLALMFAGIDATIKGRIDFSDNTTQRDQISRLERQLINSCFGD